MTAEQKRKFPPICPDFIMELRSPTDRIDTVRAKMREYIENGVRLGWLIDPETQTVEIYRPDREIETLNSPTILSGEDVLPGFTLNLQTILCLD